MSSPGSEDPPEDTLVDLLIKQIAEGLSPEEQRALDALGSGATEDLSLELERAAAAITLAGAVASEPPATLRARLQQQAEEFIAGHRVVPPSAASDASSLGGDSASSRGTSTSAREAVGWFAAAACLLLAAFGWLRTPPAALRSAANRPLTALVVESPSLTSLPASPTAAAARAALLAHPGALTVSMGPTKDPAAVGVTGDVVWDPVSQQGFMRLVGLRSNDPRVLQYQMWIFDGARDKRYPVDAGLFDVADSGNEIIIPIHAALPIRVAKAFAVTIEAPGGVVVSALHHVVVLGAAG